MTRRGRLRPAPPWSVSVAVAGWIGAALTAVVVQVVLLAVWNPPSGLGASAARAGAQVAGGAEPDHFNLAYWQFAVLQVPLWGALALVVWAVVRRHGVDLRAALGLNQRWYDIPVGLACGLLAQLLVVPAIYLPLARFIDAEDVEAPAREIMSLADGAAGVAVVVAGVVLVAPFVEELYFRGLLLRALWGRMGRAAAVAVASVLFGLAHLQLLQLPALVAFGLVAGALVVATKRLAPGMWAHAAFNSFTVVQLLR
ncbi:MAG: type II CAAX endopeptidase family protein [bacterium]|nr:type II CAAX endopeptidase family protein [bacterium]